MPNSAKRVRFSKDISESLRHRLFRDIQISTYLNSEGRVSWTVGTEIDQYISVLRDAFVFPDQLSSREISKAVWRGIMDARMKGKLSDSSVIEELQGIATKFLAEPVQKYSMWSRLSYRPAMIPSELRFSYGSVSLRLTKNIPLYMHLSSEALSGLRPLVTTDKSGFGFIIASTKARNEEHAVDKIFQATELFRSVYNLTLKPWNVIGSEQKPEATLLMGPYHFLFRGNKPLHSENTWYNPSYRDEFWSGTSANFEKVAKKARFVREALEKLEEHPLRDPLSLAFLMMNDGMEAADMSRRTLRYWTAVERLFQSDNERVSYEDIIKRATYLEEVPEIARAKLHRLVRIRNRYVHMGASENEHHQLTQYLADHIKGHHFYLLFNGDDFSCHTDFIDMTKLPADLITLQRRRMSIDRRERMIKTGRHRPD